MPFYKANTPLLSRLLSFFFFILQLAFPYQLQGCHDLGRPKQRWKDQENLQDQPKLQLLLLLYIFCLFGAAAVVFADAVVIATTAVGVTVVVTADAVVIVYYY